MNPQLLRQMLQSMSQGGGAPFDSMPDAQGRSRKYREEAGWELTGNLSSLPAQVLRTANPMVPLRFEMPPGEWSGYHYICTEAAGIQTNFADAYVNPQVMAAHLKALEAYSCYSSQEAARLAQQALALSDLCPEAYNVLALTLANSYEEALELYRKAAELGPRVLVAGCFEAAVDGAEMWLKSPYRPCYRALYGVANTLRKMGRYDESLAAYDRLIALDPNWYQFSSYVNVMATYPLALLVAKGPEALLRWMRSYKSTEDQLTYISSSLYWTATFVLAELEVSAAKGTAKASGSARVTADDKWAADGIEVSYVSQTDTPWQDLQTGRGLSALVNKFPAAVDMLLGDKALPRGILADCKGAAGEDAAAAYVYTAGTLWRSHPVALERLRRYRNTFELRALITDMRKSLPVSLTDIRYYMTAPGGFHTGALERTWGPHGIVFSLLDNMVSNPDGREFSKDDLKVLKWLLDAGCPVHNDHKDCPPDSPLHMVCYQGYGPEAVKLLVAAGADPFRKNFQRLTAVAMTANQGNWREMQALLQALPHLKTANAAEVGYGARNEYGPLLKKVTVPEALLMDLFQSSCLPCLDGGPKCMRCSNGVPHSPHANFFKYVDVVVAESGLTKLSRAVIECMEGAAHHSGVGSVWSRLYKYVMRVVSNTSKGGSSNVATSTSSSNSQGQHVAATAAATDTVSSSSSGNGSKSRQQDSKTAAVPAAVPAAAAQRDAKCCWGCGAAPGGVVSLKKCTGCRKAVYCSRECQEGHWKAHKAECKQWTAELKAKKAKS